MRVNYKFASVPDRENLVAELLIDSNYLAEINWEQQVACIDFYCGKKLIASCHLSDLIETLQRINESGALAH
jgi:hypothetical protein